MLFEPFPISTRPTLRVSREFLFDADARAVRDYLLGGNGRESRVIEIAQPPFHLWGRICRGSYRRCRYHFLFPFYVSWEPIDGARLARIFTDGGRIHEPVEILIDQSEIGKARACLLIETDLAKWDALIRMGDTISHATSGAIILLNWWDELIDGWAHRSAKIRGRRTRDARWLMLWRRIKPLYEQDRTQQEIADQLGISRRTVSKVIAWANEHRL